MIVFGSMLHFRVNHGNVFSSSAGSSSSPPSLLSVFRWTFPTWSLEEKHWGWHCQTKKIFLLPPPPQKKKKLWFWQQLYNETVNWTKKTQTQKYPIAVKTLTFVLFITQFLLWQHQSVAGFSGVVQILTPFSSPNSPGYLTTDPDADEREWGKHIPTQGTVDGSEIPFPTIWDV